jgi:trehalose utilization protein
MQKNFHILPGSNIAEMKKDLWRDMGEKLKLWKHELKHPLAIGTNDTLLLI